MSFEDFVNTNRVELENSHTTSKWSILQDLLKMEDHHVLPTQLFPVGKDKLDQKAEQNMLPQTILITLVLSCNKSFIFSLEHY